MNHIYYLISAVLTDKGSVITAMVVGKPSDRQFARTLDIRATVVNLRLSFYAGVTQELNPVPVSAIYKIWKVSCRGIEKQECRFCVRNLLF